MRSLNNGPAGVPLLIIGVLLAVSSVWSALPRHQLAEAVPSILIGLSLVSVGCSLIGRARRAKLAAREDHRE